MNLQVFLAGIYFGGAAVMLLQSVLIDSHDHYIGTHGPVEGWRYFALQVLGSIIWPLSLISAYLQASSKHKDDFHNDFHYGHDADAVRSPDPIALDPSLFLNDSSVALQDFQGSLQYFATDVREVLETVRRIEAAVCPEDTVEEPKPPLAEALKEEP